MRQSVKCHGPWCTLNISGDLESRKISSNTQFLIPNAMPSYQIFETVKIM